jgi:hypothetical protein
MTCELHNIGLVSTTVTTEDDRDRIQEFPDTPEDQPDRVCARRQLQTTLAKAIRILPARYQKVVFLYYTNEMTMKENWRDPGRQREPRVADSQDRAQENGHCARIGRDSFGGGVLARIPHTVSSRGA